MNRNASRDDLKADILNQLGEPIIKVNVTDAHLDQAINQALKYFWKYHRDGSLENYYIVTLTEADAANGWITVPNHIDAVTEVLPKGFLPSEGNFANFEWQMTASAMASAGATGGGAGAIGANASAYANITLADYALAKQNITFLRRMTGTDLKVFNFSKYQRRLYMRFPVKEGDIIAMTVSENMDPENPNIPDCSTVFDDEWLKNYTAALVKEMWGNVLRKFGGIALPGGVVLDGQALIDEGNAEAKELLEALQNEQPVDMRIG